MPRYIDAEYIEYEPTLSPRGNGMYEKREVAYKDEIDDIPTVDVVEVGKWCDMHEYILEIQADENGHNGFFRITKEPVIFSNDELKMKKELIAKVILYGADDER